MRFHEVPLQVHDHVADLVVGDAAVPKLGEVDLDAAGVVGEPRDLPDLLSRELAQPRRDVDVLPSYDDVHHGIPAASRCDPAVIGRVYAGSSPRTWGAVPGRGVRAAVTATTDVAPARRSASAAAAIVAPVVATSSTSRTRAGTAPCRASNCGPARRATAGRPVCGGPGRRRSVGRARSPSSLATERARTSAWSKPRACRRVVVVGAHVATPTSTSAPAATTSRAMRAASHGTVARVRQYLTRATSSRATPSYANGASHRSTPAGGGNAGGARNVRAHASQTGSAARPHPGHDAGNAASTSARHGFTIGTVPIGYDSYARCASQRRQASLRYASWQCATRPRTAGGGHLAR